MSLRKKSRWSKHQGWDLSTTFPLGIRELSGRRRSGCSSQDRRRGLFIQPLLIYQVFKPFCHSCCSSRIITCLYLPFVKCSVQNCSCSTLPCWHWIRLKSLLCLTNNIPIKTFQNKIYFSCTLHHWFVWSLRSPFSTRILSNILPTSQTFLYLFAHLTSSSLA